MPLFDRKDKSRYATFTRRTMMMGGGVTAVLAALARLYQLQIVNGDEYMTRAEENRVSRRLLAPLRGRILDRFGTELANNRRNYRVLLIPEQASEGVGKALDTIGRIIALTPHDHDRILRDIAGNKKFVPVTIAENMSWDEFSRVNLASALSFRHRSRCGADARLSLWRRAFACAGLCRLRVREGPAGRRRSRAVAAGLPHRQARHRESI